VGAEDLAAFLDGSLSADERVVVAAHLDECQRCRAQLADAAAVLEEYEARIKRRLWPGVAAAAAVVAALSLLPLLRPGAPDDSTALQRGERTEGAITVEVVSPPDGAQVSRAELRFVWRSAEAGARYELTLTDPQGVIVWEVALEDTVAALPSSVRLTPGTTYYWYTDALLPGAQTATTGVQELVILP
jgi:anti-sigma factor RsiW